MISWTEEQSLWKQVKPVTSLDLPDSLKGCRWRALTVCRPGERHVLQMAAVIGSVFWLNVLQIMAAPAQLQNELVVQRTGLIHERTMVAELGMEYAFDSSLIREVAYESLLNSQRIAYHLQIAEYLENIIFEEGKRRYFNTLAHHYRLAGNIKKELFYTLQAADHAQSIYANFEALSYYARGLELIRQMEEHPAPTDNGPQLYALRTLKFEARTAGARRDSLMGNVRGWEDAKALLPLARQIDNDPVWLIDALLGSSRGFLRPTAVKNWSRACPGHRGLKPGRAVGRQAPRDELSAGDCQPDQPVERPHLDPDWQPRPGALTRDWRPPV